MYACNKSQDWHIHTAPQTPRWMPSMSAVAVAIARAKPSLLHAFAAGVWLGGRRDWPRRGVAADAGAFHSWRSRLCLCYTHHFRRVCVACMPCVACARTRRNWQSGVEVGNAQGNTVDGPLQANARGAQNRAGARGDELLGTHTRRSDGAGLEQNMSMHQDPRYGWVILYIGGKPCTGKFWGSSCRANRPPLAGTGEEAVAAAAIGAELKTQKSFELSD
eukprot:6176774-Pleurochrysis_carterae.AAC.1